MPNDTQIFSGAVRAGNSDYELPGDSEIRVKAVQATFNDNGAGADWCPAVVMISDSGHTIARALLPDVKVTAGDDAEVSWFPGVKPGGAGVTAAFLGQSGLWQSRHANQSIPSGAVTKLTFTSFTSAPAYTPGLFGNPAAVQNPITFGAFGNAVMTLTVKFAAGAYDRYVELTLANPSDPVSAFSPRIRSQVTPDGDVLTLTAGILGGPGPPATTVTANVFQASGVNQNVTAEWFAHDMRGVIFLS